MVENRFYIIITELKLPYRRKIHLKLQTIHFKLLKPFYNIFVTLFPFLYDVTRNHFHGANGFSVIIDT